MVLVVLALLVGVLGVGCLILAVVVIEGRRLHGNRPVRAWRIAWSKRKQINAAIAKSRQAEEHYRQAYERMQENDREKERARSDARAKLAHMGSYIIAEQCGEHIKAIKANNYHAKEKKVLRSIEVAAKNGYKLPKSEQDQLARMLEQAHAKALRIEAEKQKQALIKEQIREEERAQRERDRAVKKAEEDQKKKEREAQIRQQALEEALALLGDTHSDEIEEMKRRVAEAQAEAEEARLAAERTKSMAQQTKQGHIYVISNIGSFGKDVYKVGMTRRLEPMHRVRELSDASVPFSFDVHAMFSADDAPALEAALHRRLKNHRVNRINFRKEFFRITLHEIITAVQAEHGDIDYEVDPEALEYFESLELAQEESSIEERIAEEAEEEEETATT